MYNSKLIKNADKIINFLEDDLSKTVFKYRLFANLTDDVRYIHSLLEETKTFQFEKALSYYKKSDEIYHVYPKFDVISFLYDRGAESPIVLFGAGHDAQLYYSLLNSAGIQISAVIDNHSEKTCFYDTPIFRPEEFDGLHNSVVVITSYIHRDGMYWEMRGRGVPDDRIFVPGKNGLWSFSLCEYFDEQIWTGREHEIFIDAGAYNLYTSFEFSKFAQTYDKIYAFEPDKDNYVLCEQNKEKYKLKNLELYNAGLWAKDDALNFSRGGDNGTGTTVSDYGDNRLEVRSLDSVLDGEPCTFIKMDIEGSELKALEGAKETIRQYKPRLAICLYHKPMDLIDIPLYIKELVPEYKMKIRHYSTWFFDTVLYAYID